MSTWKPGCDHDQLIKRALVLAAIRDFFAEKSVLEVETPLLGITTGTDPQLDFFVTQLDRDAKNKALYLQTSPEFAMKRLLAAGSGSIFQICKAFRNGEIGRLHNPEFTILEWYRVGFDLEQLMQEVAELMFRLSDIFDIALSIEKYSYSEIFNHYTDLDALNFDLDSYRSFAIRRNHTDAERLCGEQHSVWLDFIFSHEVQPFLGKTGMVMIHSYPACQAALAKINDFNPLIAERVELFMNGVELGNGYFELTDPAEQERRFKQELRLREQQNLPKVVIDEKFLASLQAGLPSCAGIAIGLDRLLMVLNADTCLDEVLSFSHTRL